MKVYKHLRVIAHLDGEEPVAIPLENCTVEEAIETVDKPEGDGVIYIDMVLVSDSPIERMQ